MRLSEDVNDINVGEIFARHSTDLPKETPPNILVRADTWLSQPLSEAENTRTQQGQPQSGHTNHLRPERVQSCTLQKDILYHDDEISE